MFSLLLYTREEQAFEDHFNKTYTRNKDGRFVLRLPFKEPDKIDEIEFESSLYSAQSMLLKMEKRFQSNFKLREMYHDFLREYEELNHMTRVGVVEPDVNRFYIPHQAVLKEKSTTTKLCTVLNASIKLKSEISLNNLLLTGPNLLPMLSDLIINWRNYRFVFVEDIEKMYRQIEIHSKDRRFQCILWRSDPNGSINVFELSTLT